MYKVNLTVINSTPYEVSFTAALLKCAGEEKKNYDLHDCVGPISFRKILRDEHGL